MNNTFLSQWKQYLINFNQPQIVVLEVTTECTVATCSHCYICAKEKGKGKYMSWEVFNYWVDIFNKTKKPYRVIITGGEPTLHPRLKEILEKIHELNIKINLVTNGETLNNAVNWSEITPYINTIEISLRGDKSLHDLFTLAADDPLWQEIPKDTDFEKQMMIGKKLIQKRNIGHYATVIKTLKNLMAIKNNHNFQLNLNIDIQAAADMVQCLNSLKEEGIEIDNICLQVTQISGRAKIYPNAIPNLWRQPTAEMVTKYLDDANRVIKNKLIKGSIMIIDPVPKEIEDKLGLNKNYWKWLYQPHTVPAISVNGYLRSNVLG